jgi:hypothetical protein
MDDSMIVQKLSELASLNTRDGISAASVGGDTPKQVRI